MSRKQRNIYLKGRANLANSYGKSHLTLELIIFTLAGESLPDSSSASNSRSRQVPTDTLPDVSSLLIKLPLQVTPNSNKDPNLIKPLETCLPQNPSEPIDFHVGIFPTSKLSLSLSLSVNFHSKSSLNEKIPTQRVFFESKASGSRRQKREGSCSVSAKTLLTAVRFWLFGRGFQGSKCE